MKTWYLEGYTGPRHTFQRIRINDFPFRIGRGEGLSLVLDSDGISREHAELRCIDDHLLLVDLGSTNGSFLNREPIQSEARIESGDILHFAEDEFRVVSEEKRRKADHRSTRQGIAPLSERLPSGGRELHQLLVNRQVDALFQPIVRYSDGTVHAWEILGRGRHPDLSESPGDLFRIAESLGMEVVTSELLRAVGVDKANAVNPGGMYFTNIHPGEVGDAERLLKVMDDLRVDYPRVKLVVELHEAAVVDKKKLRRIRDHLHDRDIGIAYDDFGRGQARLVELADVPPDYIKLDMELVKDIDRKPHASQQMVRMFAGYASDNDILLIAEGVNTDGEVGFCVEQGIDLVQGYRFGKPSELVVPA